MVMRAAVSSVGGVDGAAGSGSAEMRCAACSQQVAAMASCSILPAALGLQLGAVLELRTQTDRPAPFRPEVRGRPNAGDTRARAARTPIKTSMGVWVWRARPSGARSLRANPFQLTINLVAASISLTYTDTDTHTRTGQLCARVCLPGRRAKFRRASEHEELPID